MPTVTTPSQRRLHEALTQLKAFHDAGRHVVQTSELTRSHREALAESGYLRPIIRGWYMTSSPREGDGESTSWYATAREFIAAYCESRFGADWCLSEDFSLQLHAGSTGLPRTVMVHAPAGTNTTLPLPRGHNLIDYRAPDFPPGAKRTTAAGLRVMTLERALVGVSEAFFRAYPRDAQIALMSLKDPDGLLRELLDGGRPVVAGRLAAALRACGRDDFADEILRTMRGAGYSVTAANPFEAPPPSLPIVRGESPYVTRIRLTWAAMREDVLSGFPAEPGRAKAAKAAKAYLDAVRDSYVMDAYHSLSIEGYKVTEALLARVASGKWNPEAESEDASARDAMAARGYWQARNAVVESISRILKGEDAGRVVSADHRAWYRELFAPSVDARILTASDLAGYRGQQVYIRNAAHVPPPVEAVRDMMPALFDLLKEEPSAAVRAVLGHFLFVYIHPYMDGNGRMGRFLMNAMLASGGYPWTVVSVERRKEYMDALDAASSEGDIRKFASFVASSLEHPPEAARTEGDTSAQARGAPVRARRTRRE